MDTSRISESDETCSCRITLSPSFLWVSVGDIYSTNCTDGDPLFKLQTVDKTNSCTCQDGRINDSCTQELSKEKRRDNDVMWLIVTKNSPKLSGRIKITSKDASGIPGFPYTVECYEPNINTSTTTSAPITSTMTVNPPSEGSVSSLSQTSTTTSTSYKSTKGGIINCVTKSQQDFLVVAVIGWLVAVVAIVMFTVVLIKWKGTCRLKRDDQIPESELHPTYSGLMTGGTTVYDHIDMNHPGTQ